MTNTELLGAEHPERLAKKPDLIVRESIAELCTTPGPIVTVYLPACHPGAADSGRAERLKRIIRDTGRQLEEGQCRVPIQRILDPLEQLAKTPAIHAGGDDTVIFVAPGSFRRFRLLTPTDERLIVASHACITPALADLMPHPSFYILAISKKLVRLGQWDSGKCTEVPLPHGLLASFEESLVSDQPDHDLQNHSSGGSPNGTGPVASTRFGTGAERDRVHERLHHYFQIVDRALIGVFKYCPIVLVGIAEELAAFCSISKHPSLLTAEPTSPEHLSYPELGEHARQAVLKAQRGKAKKVLDEFRETARRDHVLSGVRDVLEAAREGRVHKLLVENKAKYVGLLGPSFSMDSGCLEGEQDLINAAAVETIRRHGEVYILDEGKIGVSSPITALLRYSG